MLGSVALTMIIIGATVLVLEKPLGMLVEWKMRREEMREKNANSRL